MQTQGVALGYDSVPLWGGRIAFAMVNDVSNFTSNIAPRFGTKSPLFLSTKGATDRSPGQRPGLATRAKHQALKGRPNSQRTEVAR